MQVKTDGLIIMERSISESDRLVTILTRKYGLIRAFVRGAKNIKNKNFSSTQLFCYSDFNIYKGRDKYIINESNCKKSFWNLRCDIEKLALAQYFCDLLLNLVVEEQNTEDILRLTLNSLYYLSEEKLSNLLIKSVFEMRLLAMSGYMPHLISCICCELTEKNTFYFVPDENGILCKNCYKYKNKFGFKLSEGVLYALRYTVYSEFNKMFSFELKKQSQIELSMITESYLLKCIEKNLKTLDFYKQLMLN